MGFFDVIKLLWSILWLLISVAFFWAAGCAGYRFIFGPAGMIVSELIQPKKRRSELLFTLVSAILLAGAALLACRLRDVSPASVLRLLLPMEDVESVMGLPDSAGSALVSAMKESPTNFLFDVFSTPESYCTLFGAAVLSALWQLAARLLGIGQEKHSLPVRALTALGGMVVTLALTVVASVFWPETREALAWVVTWGTGSIYFQSSGPLILKILYCLFIIAAGGVIFGIFMKEVTGNPFFAVIFGSVFAQMIRTPVFTPTSRIGYIVLALALAFLFKFAARLFRNRFDEATDFFSFGTENLFSDYVFNGCAFLAGAVLTALLSLAYFRFLAS